jgi:hypothetical protein
VFTSCPVFPVEMESHKLFSQAGLELWSSKSQPPMKLGVAGMYHCAQLLIEMGVS